MAHAPTFSAGTGVKGAEEPDSQLISRSLWTLRNSVDESFFPAPTRLSNSESTNPTETQVLESARSSAGDLESWRRHFQCKEQPQECTAPSESNELNPATTECCPRADAPYASREIACSSTCALLLIRSLLHLVRHRSVHGSEEVGHQCA
ncbi:hypothetical protein PAXRUDRAFT_828570 [Paxillus rubicundulus Ve08.2h10]|uniref:Uncharacterized protein n=1 Tax=Paxillus rubicundulus Ve08.2h10 TaxID=930991 RepID=A0A0D0E7C2_9AGAM|nr:hypothetical protein PAXRUDRAFT_828570 [Paxillus rubicundulus Ve08.2h10]